MTKLSDLFDIGLLKEMIEAEYIRAFHHDNGDLIGYNYTHQAQWDKQWNPATLQCRGLIVDTNGNIIARPFPKFFNLAEDLEAVAARNGMPFQLKEKLDGSLGIHYRWQGQNAIATRGAFHSDQAKRGTEMLSKVKQEFNDQWTYLFEIIYPENRVVVDYGDKAGLVHLATLETATGGRVADRYALSKRAASYEVSPNAKPEDIAELWGHLDDGNFEGFVVEYDDGYRVKVKLSEYVRLHRIMSSTSNRTIWEALKAKTDLAQMFEAVPDEFYEWAQGVALDLRRRYTDIEVDAANEFDELRHLADESRKAFALEAQKSDHAGLLFAMLDGRPFGDLIWKQLRPDTIEYPPLGGASDPYAGEGE